MPYEPKVKLGKVGNSFKITIPAGIIHDLKWKEGDILRISMDNSSLFIRKDSV
jgi:AbrB family looped-hinge helix DNA binding protein